MVGRAHAEQECGATEEPFGMQHEPHVPEIKTLGMHLRAGFRRKWREMPMSFYLIILTIPVLLLGAQIRGAQDDPAQFVFIASLLLGYFFLLLARAILDIGAALRRYTRERRDVFTQTLGDEAFTSALGERVRRAPAE